MPKNFVGEPVEHVENQEAHGENGSGDGVDPLGSVHKAPAYVVETQTGWQVCKHGRGVHLVPCRQRKSVTLVEQALLRQLLLLGTQGVLVRTW